MDFVEKWEADVTGGCWPLLTCYRDWEPSAFCYWPACCL